MQKILGAGLFLGIAPFKINKTFGDGFRDSCNLKIRYKRGVELS